MQITSQLQWILGTTIIVYVIAMYGLALYAQGQINNTEDFLVAGRRLPLSLAWMTLFATWFGAGTLLTAADEVRQSGLRAAALDPFGAGLCLLLAGMFIAGPMWRAHLLTVPDLFRRRFGPGAELVASLVMIPSYFGWIAAQFVALAGVLKLFFGIDPMIGLTLVAIVGTGYTLMGGMWSVTLTDAVQISLVILGLLVLAVTVSMELGGGNIAGGLERLIAETPDDLKTIVPTESIPVFMQWLSVLAAGALGNLPGQDLMQRVFAAKSVTVARRACIIAGSAYLVFGLIPLGMGLAGNLLLPESLNDKILPALAHHFLSPPIAVIFILAVISAVLSTIDSAILSPASVLSQNILAKWNLTSMLNLNRWSVLAVALCSLVIAYAGEDAYSLLEGAYEIPLVGLLVPMLFAIYTKPRNRHAAMASMLVGSSLWALHYFAGWDIFLQPLQPFATWQLPVSLTATVLGLLAYLICEPPWTIQRDRSFLRPRNLQSDEIGQGDERGTN